ncbi:MAG: PBP1A family penicillin-binding protein [Novosphingobium sp.]|nr:PBP1A family penicillin-binding protein [Novosphingobium sp.]
MARSDVRRRSSSGQAPPPPPPPPQPERGGWGRAFRRLVGWSAAGIVLVLMVFGIAVAVAAQSLPSYQALKSSQSGQMIVVRARDGTQLFALGPSYGRWIPFDQIPQVMKDALVSVEDRRFHQHFGIDPVGLARASAVAIIRQRPMRATSTITQQLARNVFLNNSRSVTRKLREMVLAVALETKFSKDQILELYLNKVYFGGGAYGIDSASRKFFNHPGTTLSLPEAAIIAGLVKAPSHYAPSSDVDAAVTRARVVLKTMAETGAISPEQANDVNIKDVHLAPESGQNSVRYFTDWALPQLDVLLPDNSEPIEVWTTLDAGMQRTATAAVLANVPKGAQGAMVSLDRDGAVLAMVGGTDYITSNYNRATQAQRQPGSAWKLFVYLAALEAGYTPDSAVVDEPVTIQGWSPRNSGGSYAGKIDVRTAFAYSKNTVAAQLGNEVGFSNVAAMARRFGITTPINTMPSMVLGTSDVRLIDMTRAFAAVQAKGFSVEPYGITKVKTTDGRVLYTREPAQGQSLVAPYVAAGITDLLQTAVNIGTGRAAQIGRPVAGKTGTTTSNKDGWFLGFSSGIATGVWMGRDDAKPVPGLQGGAAPARAFASYMRAATANRPVETFDTQLKLPNWQLEPDDEVNFGNPSDYQYMDDQGNLVTPNASDGADAAALPPDGSPDDRAPAGDGAPAANDDFLDRATGRERSPDQAAPARPRAAPATRPSAAAPYGDGYPRRAPPPDGYAPPPRRVPPPDAYDPRRYPRDDY